METANKTNAAKHKKAGGSKLNRSKIIQARLDPELHKAAVEMARQQRRTLSSFIEMLVSKEVSRCH